MKIRTVYWMGVVIFVVAALGLLTTTKAVNADSLSASTASWMDDFSSTSLDNRWSWIREDPSYWSLTSRSGFLRLTTQQAYSEINNLLVQDAPLNDYEIQTRLMFTPTENFQIAGLLVYQDDNNFLTLGRAFCDASIPGCVGNGIYFDHKEDGDLIGSNYAMTTAVPGEAYLKLVRHGMDYTGYVSADGNQWTLVGVHTVTINPTKVGLRVSNQITGDSEIAADFDFFGLIDKPARQYLPLVVK